MVDAADLKSDGAICGGSSPLSGTIILFLRRSDGICEYCGSIYQISNDPTILPVLIHEPRAITLEADIKVPFRTRDYMTDDDIADCVIEELRNKIASRITECMLTQQSQDIVNMTTTYRGRVRLIPPSFKFNF